MNNDVKFRDLKELYTRILPALRSRVRELKRNGKTYIHEEDIWNYLKTYKWTNSRALDLGDMVNDIFNVAETEIDSFVKDEFKNYRRKINQEEI